MWSGMTLWLSRSKCVQCDLEWPFDSQDLSVVNSIVTITLSNADTSLFMTYLLWLMVMGSIPFHSDSGLISTVSRALSSKLRGPGFKSRPRIVGSLVSILMWGVWPDWKLAIELNPVTEGKERTFPFLFLHSILNE